MPREAYRNAKITYSQGEAMVRYSAGQIASFVETLRRDGFPARTMTSERSSPHSSRKHVDLSKPTTTPRLHTRIFKEKRGFGTARGISHPLTRRSDATASSWCTANCSC